MEPIDEGFRAQVSKRLELHVGKQRKKFITRLWKALLSQPSYNSIGTAGTSVNHGHGGITRPRIK